jgi:selenide,water dikinase
VKTNLLQLTDQGGCSAKISPKQLEEILKYLPLPEDPNILVNIDTQDDAGVYRINDDLALVFTTDFFPPVCSDPYEFGEIAAANSISDVYAMGGTPVIALNIIMFPSSQLSIDVYAEILKGGFDKCAEAGVKIIGGHTIDDSPPKYGLAVVGYVHPDKIITNSGSRPGDHLVLTKPVGTGIITAAHRLGMLSEVQLDETKKLMKLLNKSGAHVMNLFNIKGATDITGFGLAGHALKMARASGVSMIINMGKVPLIEGALNLVDEGCIPNASFTNLEYAENEMAFSSDLDYNLKMTAFDAQTSGGLLISVPASEKDLLVSELKKSGLLQTSVIGEVVSQGEKLVYLSN